MRVKQAAVFLLGLYVCLVATIAHRHTAVWGGMTVPWGVILAVVGSYATARGAGTVVRSGTVWFVMGWALGLILPMLAPGDSYLVAEDALGLTFMAAGVGSLAIAAVRAPRLSG